MQIWSLLIQFQFQYKMVVLTKINPKKTHVTTWPWQFELAWYYNVITVYTELQWSQIRTCEGQNYIPGSCHS